ncbi:MAG: ribonuclease R [Rhodospirillales bacterium]|nr:ribonuclease R [Rhodospirillales bacterium]MBO6785948.1 ribonuclease R [Rhodospirillales bacterium]
MNDAPFPSKQQIADFVRDQDGRVGKREIARAFKLDADQKRTLKKVLKEMKDDGSLTPGRGKSVRDPETLPSVTVIEVTGTDLDGEVLARPVQWDSAATPPRIYVNQDGKTGPAPGTGERLLARLTKSEDGFDAKIIRRIGAAPSDILGIVIEAEGERRIRPVDKRERYEFVIDKGEDKGVEPGELVRAQGIRGPRPKLGLKRARVIERISDAEGASAISLICVHQHDIPVAFSDAAMRQAEKSKAAPLGPRDDLRSIPLVTIDGADARDFDDAVFAEPDDDPKNKGGFKLIVAIADVAWYVRPGDPLDKAAFERGNSVYFPDRVVPMLPEQLSNGWCSLRPNEDRPCLVAHLKIDTEGNLLAKRFTRAMMRSHARLTYEQLQMARDGNPDELTAPFMDQVVEPLYAAFDILLRAREARGALEIESDERRVMLDDHGDITGIEPRQRLDSHKLIEEFMVLANVAAAEFLEEKKRPCMYRVHDEPSMSKIESLSEVLDSVHIRFDRGQTVTPHRFNQILKKVHGTAHQQMINDVVLRSQAQAMYDPENIGHFGLALKRYCHFTSPIRRYADLLVHRALIRGMKPADGALGEDPGDFAKIGEHLSVTERRAQAAERDAMDRYGAYFMKDKVGATFMARISGVTRFGIFITVDEVGADGLVPIKTLPQDYYIHDEERHLLRGRSNGIVYRLGDRVEVVLREITPVTGGMLFEVMGAAESTGKSGSRKPVRPATRKSKPKKVKGKSRASRRQKRNDMDGGAKKGAKGKRKGGRSR